MRPENRAQGDLTPNLSKPSAPLPPASPTARKVGSRRSPRSPTSPAKTASTSATQRKGMSGLERRKLKKGTPSPVKSIQGTEANRVDSNGDAVRKVQDGSSASVRSQGGDEDGTKEKTNETNKRTVCRPDDGAHTKVVEESAPKVDIESGLVTEEILEASGTGNNITRNNITEEVIEQSPTTQPSIKDANVHEEVLDGSTQAPGLDEIDVTEEVLDEGKEKTRSSAQRASREDSPRDTATKMSIKDNAGIDVRSKGKQETSASEQHVTEEVLEQSEPRRRSGSGRGNSSPTSGKSRRRSGKSSSRAPLLNKMEKSTSAVISREKGSPVSKKDLPSIGLHAMSFVADVNAPSDIDEDFPEASRRREAPSKNHDVSSSESDASSSAHHSAHPSRPGPWSRGKVGKVADRAQNGSGSEWDEEHSEGDASEYSGSSGEPNPPNQELKPRKGPSENRIVRKSLGKRPRVLISQKQITFQKPAEIRKNGPSTGRLEKMRSATATAVMGRDDATIPEALKWLEGMIRARRQPGRPSKRALRERERLERQRDQLRRELRALEEQQGDRRTTRKPGNHKTPQETTEQDDSSSLNSADISGQDSTPESNPNKITSEPEADVTLVKNVKLSAIELTEGITTKEDGEVDTAKDIEDVEMVEGLELQVEQGDLAGEKPGNASFSRFKGKKSPSQTNKSEDPEAEPDTKMKLGPDTGVPTAISPDESSESSEDEGKTEVIMDGGQGEEKQSRREKRKNDGLASERRKTWAVKHPRPPAARRMMEIQDSGKNTESSGGKAENAIEKCGADRKRKEPTASFASVGKREPEKKRRRADGLRGSQVPQDAVGRESKALAQARKGGNDKVGGDAAKDGEETVVIQTGADTLAGHRALDKKDAMIVSLREKDAQMPAKLDKGSRRAMTRHTAVETDGAGAAKATEPLAKVAELEAKLGDKERELSERDDQLREKSAAMKGFLAQIKRLEAQVSVQRTSSGSKQGSEGGSEDLEGALLRVAELEAVASERSAELEYLREGMQTKKGASEAQLRTHMTKVARLEAGLAEKERQVSRLQSLVHDGDRLAEEQLTANLACIAELEVALREKTRSLERGGAGGEGESGNEEGDRAGLVRIAELESALEDKDERMERLRQQVRNHASVLKGAVKANRNLQQKLYAVNRVR